MSFSCHELARRIEELQPEALPRDVARLCLLLTNYQEDLEELEDDARLTEIWQEMGMRLQAATDQHAAMTAELEDLAQANPKNFTMDQVWTLIRAIKVQSQVLQLYVGKQPTNE
jgi:DNA-binding transcriptional regulator GbsR (MarR family)